MQKGLQSGKLTAWKDRRGFGFITSTAGKQQIFLHISEIKDLTRRPQVGDAVYYYTIIKDGKLRAQNAFILGARRKPKPFNQDNSNKTFARFLWQALTLSAFPVICSMYLFISTQNIGPLVLYPVVSIITFLAYADDKNRAQTNRWRTPESSLHLLEVLGGWPGGFIAQKKLRHKNRKTSYQAVFWLIVALHYIGWMVWLGWSLTG